MATATGMSRRSADTAVKTGRVTINLIKANLGDAVNSGDEVRLDDKKLIIRHSTTIMLNKPPGYVCSRKGQGNKTVYELLPEKYRRLKPVGRLDKDSSGLLVMTDDGKLANRLSHPRYQKDKTYLVTLNKKLSLPDKKQLLTGVGLDDGLSKFLKLKDCSDSTYEVVLAEGRNRQIRRTLDALGYEVITLKRIKLADLALPVSLRPGDYLDL